MKYLELTFADPARNLACDEALLDLCQTADAGEVLRLWEPDGYFVVLGYSNKFASEVAIGACAAKKIPIFRRFSGGGAVLQGPGCLNYSLIIKNTRRGSVGDVAASFRRVLEPHQRLLTRLLSESVAIEGISDLTLAGKKFSGNSQHRKLGYTLFHGTFLVNFDLSLMEQFLRMPSRQPDYRRARPHADFLTNLPIDSVQLRQALKSEWGAEEEFRCFPSDKLEQLVRERYAHQEWNLKF